MLVRPIISEELNHAQAHMELRFKQGCGSGPFSVEAEARKFHHFRFHIGGKNRGKKEIGSAILWRRANTGSVHIKK